MGYKGGLEILIYSLLKFFYGIVQLQVEAGQDPRMRADLGEVNLGKRVGKSGTIAGCACDTWINH